ncbi:hypothetical protein [Pseudoxanthomonas kaohsiungensis]|uniref:hypothetical protein n=1 Tax=Pseudoxanthomonas kaohsiungensis TaxID=283923 RepID=UPI0035B1367A
MRVAFVQVREGRGPVGLGRHRDWLARQRRRWRWRCGVAGMRVMRGMGIGIGCFRRQGCVIARGGRAMIGMRVRRPGFCLTSACNRRCVGCVRVRRIRLNLAVRGVCRRLAMMACVCGVILLLVVLMVARVAGVVGAVRLGRGRSGQRDQCADRQDEHRWPVHARSSTRTSRIMPASMW